MSSWICIDGQIGVKTSMSCGQLPFVHLCKSVKARVWMSYDAKTFEGISQMYLCTFSLQSLVVIFDLVEILSFIPLLSRICTNGQIGIKTPFSR